MEYQYYICVREPENKGRNLFITYAFNGASNFKELENDKFFIKSPSFSLGYIYHTTSFDKDYILDNNSNTYNLSDVIQYLKPFEFKIDESVQKVLKKKKGDLIEIIPIKANNENVIYAITITTKTKQGTRVISQVIGTNVYECLLNCYHKLRKSNANYGYFYSLLVEGMYPIILRKKKS